MAEKNKRWAGEPFSVRLSVVRKPDEERPSIDVPALAAELLHRLHGGISSALVALQASLEPDWQFLETEWKEEADRLDAQEGKAKLDGVPTEVLRTVLKERESDG